ncbi:hypothetical protein TNCT_227361 [Trichonephila clavata]|uniref:Uncharacterized protein n=1 Tax=Trichonephila clavata TaxID=2740835 RepID=A0A8X6I7B3_TRICU|nr:hypothetical protein TNCT_227361 [Trichonephila clavata]
MNNADEKRENMFSQHSCFDVPLKHQIGKSSSQISRSRRGLTLPPVGHHRVRPMNHMESFTENTLHHRLLLRATDDF